jgi:hypothetical protein
MASIFASSDPRLDSDIAYIRFLQDQSEDFGFCTDESADECTTSLSSTQNLQASRGFGTSYQAPSQKVRQVLVQAINSSEEQRLSARDLEASDKNAMLDRMAWVQEQSCRRAQLEFDKAQKLWFLVIAPQEWH